MKISRQEDYALLISADLAAGSGNEFISLATISHKHGISMLFCKKICRLMKNSGLLVSKEGIDGGYKLAKSPKLISIWEIISAVNEAKVDYPLYYKNSKNCPLNDSCQPQYSHQKVISVIEDSLSMVKLSELVTKGENHE